jgi:nucleotide-binding universal stress UspA family protein
MTDIRHIAVLLNGGGRDAAILAAASSVAATHEAAMSAIFVEPLPYALASINGFITAEIMEAQREIYRRRRDLAATALAAIPSTPAGKADFIAAEGPAAQTFIRLARLTDLAVLGQASPDDTDAATDIDLPADIVLGLGRPVLLVPYAGTFPRIGTRILAGWNSTRESTRALADALPFLRRAEQVTLLAINPREKRDTLQSALGAWLTRHKIKGKVEIEKTEELEVGDAMLSRAADLSADLIVMGGYGRPRLREFILGGATQSMFRSMTVPVLMAH